MSWHYPSGTSQLWGAIIVTVLVGFGIMFALLQAPPRMRRWVVGAATFVAGAIYVAYYLWPKAQGRGPTDLPVGMKESVGFWLQDAVAQVGDISQTLTVFLLGLGIYSLVHIHSKRLFRMQKDWSFSLVLLISMAVMIGFGYYNYWLTNYSSESIALQDYAGWHWPTYFTDFLFDGLLQQMDAAMFSIIAFYILSAAFRAFRVRSVEATILLSAALIIMLGIMGAVEYKWNSGVDAIAHGNAFIQNFELTEITKWISNTIQTSSLRALDFGVGLGALAMGLRLWLSLERGGISS